MNLIKSYKREAYRDGAGDRTVRMIGGGENGHGADDQWRWDLKLHIKQIKFSTQELFGRSRHSNTVRNRNLLRNRIVLAVTKP